MIPTDQQIVDCLARHGIGWGDEQGVTAYSLDGEDAPVYIGAVRELLAAPASEPVAFVDSGDDGLFVEILYGDNGSPLRFGDKLYAAPQGASHE